MLASKFLISGFDTIECAYYLIATDDYKLDFIELAAQKESMVRAKVTKPKPIQIGSEEFLIASHGTSSGYPFVCQCMLLQKYPRYQICFRIKPEPKLSEIY